MFDKDTFVREVLQNARDQRRPDADRVRVRFRLEEISGAELDTFLTTVRWTELESHLERSGTKVMSRSVRAFARSGRTRHRSNPGRSACAALTTQPRGHR